MVEPLLCAGQHVGTMETVVTHVEVGVALGELAVPRGDAIVCDCKLRSEESHLSTGHSS